MSEEKRGKVKKFLPAIVLISSFYYSLLLALGLFLGYLGAKIYCKKLGIDEKNGTERKIFVDCGKWKIHFHHWILGAIFLAVVWIVDYFYLPKFFVGAVAGIMAHDIYDFNDWYKVISKNDKQPEQIS